jgi:hypothetical protein
MPLLRRNLSGGEALCCFIGIIMKNDFSFSEDTAQNEPLKQQDADCAKPRYDQSRPLHNLPRGKAWNPAILKKWWFWPASIGALIALNLAVTLWTRFFGR